MSAGIGIRARHRRVGTKDREERRQNIHVARNQGSAQHILVAPHAAVSHTRARAYTQAARKVRSATQGLPMSRRHAMPPTRNEPVLFWATRTASCLDAAVVCSAEICCYRVAHACYAYALPFLFFILAPPINDVATPSPRSRCSRSPPARDVPAGLSGCRYIVVA